MATEKKIAAKKAANLKVESEKPVEAKLAAAKKTPPKPPAAKKIAAKNPAPVAHTTLIPNTNWPFPTGTKP